MKIYFKSLLSTLIITMFILSLGSLPSVESNQVTAQNPSISPRGTLSEGSSNSKDIFVMDNTAFVADGPDGLRIVKIVSEGTNQIFETLSIVDTNNAIGVFVDKSIAYIADGSFGLVIVDVKDLKNPEVLSTIQTNNPAMAVSVKNNVAFISTALGVSVLDGGFESINVEDPSNPERLDNINFSGQGRNIIVQDEYAYVVGWITVFIFDITNPSNISLESEIDHPSFSLDLAIQDTNLLIVGQEGLYIYDINNLQEIRLLSFYETDRPVNSISVIGNTAVLAATNKVELLSIENKSSPRYYSELFLEGTIQDVTWDGVSAGWIQVAAGERGIYSIYITYPSDPELAGELDPTTDDFVKLLYHNNLIFGGSRNDGVKIYDISDLKSIELVSTISVNDTIEDMIIMNNQLFVAAGYDGLLTIDFSDPVNPRIITSSQFGDSKIIEIDAFNEKLYVHTLSGSWYSAGGDKKILHSTDKTSGTDQYALSTGGDVAFAEVELHIGRITALNELEIYGNVSYPGRVYDLEIIENAVYMANDNYGVRVFNITDRNNPEEISRIDTPGQAVSLTISGDLAFVGDGHGSINILNISNTLSPKSVISHRDYDLGFSWDIASIDNTIFVADGVAGIDIYNFNFTINTPEIKTTTSTITSNGENRTIISTLTTTSPANGLTIAVFAISIMTVTIFICRKNRLNRKSVVS